MRLLLCCPHFTPDINAATGVVMTRLVESLADRGHEIDVVTSLPWYKGHRVAEEWKGRPWRLEKTEWGSITRVYPFPTSKTNIAARAVGFVGFTSLVAGHAISKGKIDVVMGMSPPIFMGEAAYLAARRRRVPFVFNIQDIFPDVAVELRALTNKRVIGLAKRYEKSLYRRSDAITVLSQDQRSNIVSKLPYGDSSKVKIIPNFVDTTQIKVTERDNAFRAELGVKPNQTLVMYAGNVGLSQSFDLVRYAAEYFRARPDVMFCINGEGAARAGIDRWSADMDNVIVRDFAERERLSEVLGAADIHLILLKRGLAKSSTPSKLYSILSAARPVVASIDQPSEVASVIDNADCGVSVPPELPAEFIAALEKMITLGSDELGRLGDNARKYASRPDVVMDAATQAAAYEKLFQELL